MDVHIHAGATKALRLKGIDVVTAQEDGMREESDPRLLDRATSLGRVLVTHDTDFLAEAGRRQKARIQFAGVIYSHALNITVGQLIEQIELVCRASDAEHMRNRVEHLPF